MRYLVIGFALALAAIGAGSASAGGWATVGLASMPEGVSSGDMDGRDHDSAPRRHPPTAQPRV